MILPDQSKHLFQACLSMKDENTRKQEIEALAQAMDELKMQKGTIITLEDEEKETIINSGVITITPSWKAFLSADILVSK